MVEKRFKEHFRFFLRFALAFIVIVSLLPHQAYAEEDQPPKSLVEAAASLSTDTISRMRNGNSINELGDPDTYRSRAVTPMANAVNDTRMDLRERGVVTPVKQQGPWGTCWGFAAIAASETSLMSELGLNTTDQVIDLSELHLAWFAGTALPAGSGSQEGEGQHPYIYSMNNVLNMGGKQLTATSVLSSGTGPVPESTVPYKNKEGFTVKNVDGQDLYYSSDGDWSVDEGYRFSQAVELENSCVLPSPSSRDETGSYEYDPKGTHAIKSELEQGRAVTIAFSADTSRPGQTDPPKYINPDTWAHYTYSTSASVNHAVTIVGWDDDYSVENFLDENRPPDNGAWIVKNSWGSKEGVFPHASLDQAGWGIDGSGYFFLSYYDKSISFPETFDYRASDYQKSLEHYMIDQYDFMPSSGINSVSFSEESSMANVFEAGEDQAIRSLSCETATPNTTVTYEVYILKHDFAHPEDGVLAASITDVYPYGGFHKTELDQAVSVAEGQKYSVVATLASEKGFEVLYDAAVNKKGADAYNKLHPGKEIGSYAVGVVNPGESFACTPDSGWEDWKTLIPQIQSFEPDGDYLDYDNFPIKAFADPADIPLTSISYDANGGDGNFVDEHAKTGKYYTTLSAAEVAVSYKNHRFLSWNTKQDGTGTAYMAGDSFFLRDRMTLYAQWEVVEQAAVDQDIRPLAKTGDALFPETILVIGLLMSILLGILGVKRIFRIINHEVTQ